LIVPNSKFRIASGSLDESTSLYKSLASLLHPLLFRFPSRRNSLYPNPVIDVTQEETISESESSDTEDKSKSSEGALNKNRDYGISSKSIKCILY
jgi:hypothetical protein